MDKKELGFLKLAKMAHINNAIWAKLGEGGIKDFTCCWDELTEYQKEFYIAGVELLIIEYRLTLSSARWLWKIYYRWRGSY